MTGSLEQLKTTLKRQRRSLTHPREAVFMALQNHEPRSINQLVVACPLIDRASVYRTVALFEELGIIQRLQIGWKYKLELSDSFHRHHHHLSCSACGRIIPLEEDQKLESRLHELAKLKGFKIQSHQLELQGLCEDCQKS